jgi:hypothetical protein
MKLNNYYYLDTIEHFGDVIKGDTGNKGYNGFIGDAGGTGLKGLMGAIGSDGLRGAKGIQGDRGNKGDIGDPGNAGKPGKIGIKGNIGAPGPTGNKGPVGPMGSRGDIGPRGKSGIQGREGLPGPKGESGKSFSTNTVNTDVQCDGNWIKIPANLSSLNKRNILPNDSYCPNNSALSGIKTKNWTTKIETKTKQKVGCKRCTFAKIRSCWLCGEKMGWKLDPAMTTWQVNKSYEMCCTPMPFKSDGEIEMNESDNELIDPYYGSAGSEDPSSLLYGLSLEQIREKSIKNYPFHPPV